MKKPNLFNRKQRDDVQQPLPDMVIVPLTLLLEMKEDLQFFRRQADEKGSKQSMNNWVTEEEAKELLGKQTTWFWKMRKTGELPFTKVGGKVLYDLEDIYRLLERNKHSAA